MTLKLVGELLLITLGISSICGSYFDWDWFMRLGRPSLFANYLGRNGARIIYFAGGILMIVMGVLSLMGIIDWTQIRTHRYGP